MKKLTVEEDLKQRQILIDYAITTENDPQIREREVAVMKNLNKLKYKRVEKKNEKKEKG